jgi:methylmalonyl-CoA/ethylmalonyl-CoA epimerase
MRVAVTHIGASMVELIAPTSNEAAFAKYLTEKGPGMHHIAYRVDDIVACLAKLKDQGLRLVDELHRASALHDALHRIHSPQSNHGNLD